MYKPVIFNSRARQKSQSAGLTKYMGTYPMENEKKYFTCF